MFRASTLRLPIAACCLTIALGGPASQAAEVGALTVYNGQDEGPVEAAIAAYEKKTGVKVAMRKAGSPAFANQIAQEGAHSPADIFYAEYTSPLAVLKNKDLLGSVAAPTLAEVPARFNDHDGTWIGVTARSQVLVYHAGTVQEAVLPSSVLDLAKPEWKDRIAFNPKSAAFLEQLTAIAKVEGHAKAKTWLEALKANAKAYPSNTAMIMAVERGEVPVAIVGDNYWFAVAKEKGGTDKMASRIHYIGHGDPGAQITVSGAAMLKAAPHPEEAQRFLAFLVSPEGQQAIAATAADYPLRPGVPSPFAVKPFAELDPSPVTPSEVGTAREGLDLEREVGLN
ncbi:extracellular solute-binding protein [Lichenihabitans sp. Uapishka_5]|uniref:extracellular solute-binding protein n=1 Tax=Lichenihabitans sp. Uapishka_5 TaxID=3037302 RepID=UPI0029E81696|nr:extracellular solute-binding protein [Lichenihabitans sp. Uapishka_5]MDX7950444.1 extracellular solute-binding protein [Lichenihabitans sp. Uapishka_5]